MTTMLMRCEAPMQSWGSSSHFDVRDTDPVPTKSGVTGILAAATGRRRGEPIDDLVKFRMGVRVDRPGFREFDFQTASNVAKASGASPDTVVSKRYYLADASFLVGLEGERALLEQFDTWLRQPVWALYLGRRGYVPSLPLFMLGATSVFDLSLVEALTTRWPDEHSERLEAVIECLPREDGDIRRDVPLSFASNDRRHTSRRVRTQWLSRPTEASCT